MSDAAIREVEELRAEVARLRARFRLKRGPWPSGPKLRDGLVLIGATALGLAVLRAKGRFFLGHYYGLKSPTEYFSHWSPVAAVGHGYAWSALLVAMWTLALFWFHLRQPRPRLRRLARRPGFAVCLAAALSYSLSWLLMYVESVVNRATMGLPLWVADFDGYVCGPPLPAGLAAGSVWAVLALGGRGCPARDWLDRAGCVLGVYWLVMIPASLLLHLPS